MLKANIVLSSVIVGLLVLFLILGIVGCYNMKSLIPAYEKEVQVVYIGEERVKEDVSPTYKTGGVDEAIVRFADGFDSNGKVMQEGSKVNGPAIVKEDPNNAFVIAVYPDATYVLKTDAVVWAYEANELGLQSQFQFFDKIVEEIR